MRWAGRFLRNRERGIYTVLAGIAGVPRWPGPGFSERSLPVFLVKATMAELGHDSDAEHEAIALQAD